VNTAVEEIPDENRSSARKVDQASEDFDDTETGSSAIDVRSERVDSTERQ